jgi:hypothetical protein
VASPAAERFGAVWSPGRNAHPCPAACEGFYFSRAAALRLCIKTGIREKYSTVLQLYGNLFSVFT